MAFQKTHRSRLRIYLAATAASLTLSYGSWALADSNPKADAPVYDWSGLYVGANTGMAFGSFKTNTSADPNGTYLGDYGYPFYFEPSDAIAINQLGKQNMSPNGFTGGAEIGYNWQDGNFVAGISTDLDFMRMNGSSHASAAYSNGYPFLESSYGNADWLITVRPRIGYADGSRLFYVTGGLALANPREDTIFTDGYGAVESASRNSLQAGYTIGVGAEWAISDHLTMKAEFSHVEFGNEGGHQTSSDITPASGFIPAQGFGHSFSFNANIVRIGVNYHLGDDSALIGNAQTSSLSLPDWVLDWQAEIGLRLWYNNGRIGAPNPLLNYYDPSVAPEILASRITFSGLDSFAGETYARFDNDNGIFVKGYIGAGGINGGHQNDEDFPAYNVYSNTLSTASGALAYATVDAGYTFLKSQAANFGAFVGYNHYTEDVNSFGCVQIAQDYYCGVPSKSPGLIQDDTYNSLRVGLSSQFMPSDSLRFTADIAYLPAMEFRGRDDHNFRQLLLPQSATSGDGVMLDASLDYLVTDAWSVGIGGRYWTYNMRNGSSTFVFLQEYPPFSEPSRYNSERYGVFLQTSYRLGSVDKQKADTNEGSFNWTGVYAGATLGAGFGDQKWRDPYPSTTYCTVDDDPCPDGDSVTNQAGFGDRDHASGPLAGVRLAGNWQTDDNWVVGLEAEASWADIKGQGTCFSGLGGVNCGHSVSAVYDLAVRGGYAWDRTFAFLKVGSAWVDTKESIFGDTYAYGYTSDVFGNGHVNETQNGFLLGLGVEFAIDDNWTSSFEYNHIGGLSGSPLFSTVSDIGNMRQHVSQTLNFINVGLSYKLY